MRQPIEPASELSFGTQRYMLQQQLRAQRQQIIEQFNLDSDPATPHFPRSAIMRFLIGKSGNKLVTGFILRKLGMRYPGMLANAYSLMRMFNK